MKTITRNAIRCKKCDVVLESKHHYDLVVCGCNPPVGVDGGKSYLKRIGHPQHYEELSVTDRKVV